MAEKPTFAVHSYPWYISDWVSSETRIEFTMEQRGLYRELLDYCYREGSLPADPRKLAIIAGCGAGEFERAWPAVEGKFTRTGDRFVHRKVDEVLTSLEAWHDQRRKAGKASGLRRRTTAAQPLNERSNGKVTAVERPLNGRGNEKGNGKATKPEPSTSSSTTTPSPTTTTSSTSSDFETPSAAKIAAAADLATETFDATDEQRGEAWPNGNGNGTSKKSLLNPEIEAELSKVASRIHARHPAVRRCGLAEVKHLLRAIVRKAKSAKRLDALREIDQNHAGWCTTPGWKKENGQYAKGLPNWLALTKERWNEAPPSVSDLPEDDGYRPAAEWNGL